MEIKVILSEDEYRAMDASDEQLEAEIKKRIESSSIGAATPKVEAVVLVVTRNKRDH